MSASVPKVAKKKPAKTKATSLSPAADIFAALLADTADLKRAGWSQPPGARWLDYARPRNAFAVHAEATTKALAGPLPTVARFAVASQVLPRLTQAVSVAERIHQSLVKISDNASVFTGLDPEGKPLHGHQHARIFAKRPTNAAASRALPCSRPLALTRTPVKRLASCVGFGATLRA